MWGLALPVSAKDGNVVYDGNAREFIFAPGSDFSPTDLFPEFKDVMPGDRIVQEIVVKNTADNDRDVKIYLRALGAHENSVDFLSQLRLRVEKQEEQGSALLFDGAASEKVQLNDWVCLGSFASGSEVELQVILEVPVELDNAYSSQIGKLDWEFMVEEFPIEEEEDTPQTPEKPSAGTGTATGDMSYREAWQGLLWCSACVMLGMLWPVLYRTDRKKS